MPDVLLIRDAETDHGLVRVLRLNRPGARNAMDTGLLMALLDALHEVESDDDVRGVLVA
ncbi:MAG: enoyl-CoA hydratase/carnithine racemase, partial [Glaciecola sp.]